MGFDAGVPQETGLAGAGSTDELARALALIEALQLPVVACDAQGGLALANAAARDLWQLPGELVGGGLARDAAGFANDPERPAASDPFARALAGEHSLPEWRLVLSADGQPRPALVSVTALQDAHGAMLGAAMTILAVGGEPASQTQLQNYAADLEMLTDASRLLAEVSDPDQAAAVICTVATGATGAIAVLMWQLTEGNLVMSHWETGFASDDLSDLTKRVYPGAATALSESKPTIERLAADRNDGGPEPGRVGGAGVVPLTAWHEPLTIGGRPVGVLSILWPGLLDDLERPAVLIGALAQHAATALERTELLRRLGQAARTDALTGLANRRVWQERLDHELARARRDQHPFSLVLIDIDHFKGYNDRYGHPQGDRLLSEAATAWSQRLRKTDLLARVGGEEFSAILPGCSSEAGQVVAESLRAAMPDGQTCSIGVVTSDGLASASELYAAADAALYRAKRHGRNRADVGELVENIRIPID
jgi:diguanylate cyclase (GGDEF)-like protein